MTRRVQIARNTEVPVEAPVVEDQAADEPRIPEVPIPLRVEEPVAEKPVPEE